MTANDYFRTNRGDEMTSHVAMRKHVSIGIGMIVFSAGCSSTRISDHWPAQPGIQGVYRYYQGEALPLEQVAILQVVPPICFVKELRPPLSFIKKDFYYHGAFSVLPGDQTIYFDYFDQGYRSYAYSKTSAPTELTAEAGHIYRTFYKVGPPKRMDGVVTDVDSMWQPFIFDVTDEETVHQIAQEGIHPEFRKQALSMTTNQSIIAQIANHDPDTDVRQVAIKKLTSPVVLAKVAKHDKDAFVRQAAISKLMDAELLADILVHDKDKRVRSKAKDRLSELAQSSSGDPSVKKMAKEQIKSLKMKGPR